MRGIEFDFSLQLLLAKRPAQVNLGGERERTPLHYAALIDNVEAAQILVRIDRARTEIIIAIDRRRITMLDCANGAPSVIIRYISPH